MVQGTTWPAFHFFQFLSNDDGQCLQFSLKSQAIRVKRICSTVETTKQRLGDLRHHLKKRGYNDKIIESGFSKASEINRNDLLEYKEKKINKRVPLVLTYHPSLEKIAGIVRHHWKEIEKSETLAKLFPEPPVVAFRRPKSIKDTLVRAAVSRPSSMVAQCKPCGDKRCKCCLQLQHTQVFYSKTTGKEYKIFCNINCKHLMWFTSLTVTSAGRNT